MGEGEEEAVGRKEGRRGTGREGESGKGGEKEGGWMIERDRGGKTKQVTTASGLRTYLKQRAPMVQNTPQTPHRTSAAPGDPA